jgi:hypothetical protein
MSILVALFLQVTSAAYSWPVNYENCLSQLEACVDVISMCDWLVTEQSTHNRNLQRKLNRCRAKKEKRKKRCTRSKTAKTD